MDYREVLSGEEFAVFAKLRALRKRLAESEGVPVYAVFTNEQLAAMATRRMSTASALATVGVGEAPRQIHAAFPGAGSAPRADGARRSGVRPCPRQRRLRLPPRQGRAHRSAPGAAATPALRLVREGRRPQLLRDHRPRAAAARAAPALRGPRAARPPGPHTRLLRGRPGKGLPIGALTSQHLANLYLDPLDRHLLGSPAVGGMVRYMDDVVWWAREKDAVLETLASDREHAAAGLSLELKPAVRVNRSARGLTLCGFRILPGTLRLSRRPNRRYVAARRRWERRFEEGRIDPRALQAGYCAALAITAHADAAAWRRRELLRRPARGACGLL